MNRVNLPYVLSAARDPALPLSPVHIDDPIAGAQLAYSAAALGAIFSKAPYYMSSYFPGQKDVSVQRFITVHGLFLRAASGSSFAAGQQHTCSQRTGSQKKQSTNAGSGTGMRTAEAGLRFAQHTLQQVHRILELRA